MDVSRSSDGGIKCKIEVHLCFFPSQFWSGLKPKTEKDGSSVDISELPSKGDRFESLHEYRLPACEFLWFFQSLQAYAEMILVVRSKPLLTQTFPNH